jgi:hypothetical protein
VDLPFAFSKVPAEVQAFFQQFHKELELWVTKVNARIESEAHSRGVTYIAKGQTFFWLDLTKTGLSLAIPKIRATDYPNAKPTLNTPGNRDGIRLTVKLGDNLQTAIKAVQDAYMIF